jgi:HSP20 family protein
MTMIKFNPLPTLEKAAKKMNEFIGETERNVSFEVGGFTPRVDIIDHDNNIYVKAELPGIDKESISVSVNEDKILTLSGSKVKSELTGEMSYLRNERIYSDFKRSFVLPDSANIEKINASYEDGVLTLVIPKTEPAKPKEIKVDIL